MAAHLILTPTTGFLRAAGTEGGIQSGDKCFYENMLDQLRRRWEPRHTLAGARFATDSRRCCEVCALNFANFVGRCWRTLACLNRLMNCWLDAWFCSETMFAASVAESVPRVERPGRS
jgi:hypothetical protein